MMLKTENPYHIVFRSICWWSPACFARILLVFGINKDNPTDVARRGDIALEKPPND
jgi:hypothetical protein